MSTSDGIWSVYIVKCADNTLYTGVSNNVRARVVMHDLGKGAKYTRTRLPVTLVYIEKVGSRGEAQSREHQIKKMGRKYKLGLIERYAVDRS